MAEETTIIVNGREKIVAKGDITFDQVVALAEDLPTGALIEYTVKYTRGRSDQPKGTLHPGESIKVNPSMVFHVTATDKS